MICKKDLLFSNFFQVNVHTSIRQCVSDVLICGCQMSHGFYMFAREKDKKTKRGTFFNEFPRGWEFPKRGTIISKNSSFWKFNSRFPMRLIRCSCTGKQNTQSANQKSLHAVTRSLGYRTNQQSTRHSNKGRAV